MLHSGSILGKRIVIGPNKTFRVNLSTVKPLNLDFDGDEVNIHIPRDYNAIAEMEITNSTSDKFISCQSSKPQIIVVQDALLGAYLLTKENKPIDKGVFFNICLNGEFRRTGDYLTPRDQRHWTPRFIQRKIKHISRFIDPFIGRGLFSMTLPSNFYLNRKIDSENTVIIEQGVLLQGYINKVLLKDSHNSIIQLLFKEYNVDVAMEFVDNVQFLMNNFLLYRGFSVGIKDCIAPVDTKLDIQKSVNRCFMEAKVVFDTVKHEKVRDAKLSLILNKARDSSMKMAKDALTSDNSFISTVTAGSKGDLFNIAQISGSLGQQSVSGGFVKPVLSSNRRTLPHYPKDLTPEKDASAYFQSRGFIRSSFLKGLSPQECFFHAMCGRESVSDTAMKTQDSGYTQRKMIKTMEDVQIGYDRTVRNSVGYIIQFAFSDDALDRSKTVILNGKTEICDVGRIIDTLKKSFNLLYPNHGEREMEIDEDYLLDFIEPNPGLPKLVGEKLVQVLKDKFSKQIKDKIYFSLLPVLKDKLKKQYFSSLIEPGNCVGAHASMSIGERHTQSTLSSFHQTGQSIKAVVTGVPRFTELLNATKEPKAPSNSIFFKERYQNISDIRKILEKNPIKEVKLKDLIIYREIIKGKDIREDWIEYFSVLYDKKIVKNEFYARYQLNVEKLFEDRLSLEDIAKKIEDEYLDGGVLHSPDHLGILFVLIDTRGIECSINDIPSILQDAKLEHIHICGIEGIKEVYFTKTNDGEWFIETNGSNYQGLLSHTLVDPSRLTTNDMWEIYNTIGIEATRSFLIEEFCGVVGAEVNECHSKLLVDVMTFKGTISSASRYTLRKEQCGPLAKASFEESMDNLLQAGIKCEIENTNGVSASIMLGKVAHIGTGMCDLVYDQRVQIREEEEDHY